MCCKIQLASIFRMVLYYVGIKKTPSMNKDSFKKVTFFAFLAIVL